MAQSGLNEKLWPSAHVEMDRRTLTERKAMTLKSLVTTQQKSVVEFSKFSKDCNGV